jgi:hypothetical protein
MAVGRANALSGSGLVCGAAEVEHAARVRESASKKCGPRTKRSSHICRGKDGSCSSGVQPSLDDHISPWLARNRPFGLEGKLPGDTADGWRALPGGQDEASIEIEIELRTIEREPWRTDFPLCRSDPCGIPHLPPSTILSKCSPSRDTDPNHSNFRARATDESLVTSHSISPETRPLPFGRQRGETGKMTAPTAGRLSRPSLFGG